MSEKNYGFVRVAAVRPELRLADPLFNAMKMAEAYEKAWNKNAQVMFFPELSLTGYSCKDLFRQSSLRRGAEDGLKMFLAATAKYGSLAVVGMPLEVDGVLYNVAVFCHQGKPIAVIPKTFIPTNGEFEEWRWFKPATYLKRKTISLCGFTDVPIGTDLVIETNIPGVVVSAEICEDLWPASPPSGHLAAQGVTICGNLSASDDLVGKNEYCENLVVQQSARCYLHYVYCSSGWGESTSEVVFGGRLLIASNGQLVASSTRRRAISDMLIADVDVEAIIHDRLNSSSYAECVGLEAEPYRRVRVVLPELNLHNSKLLADINPYPFVPQDPLKRDQHCAEVLDLQQTGLKRRLLDVERVTGKREVVLGISGGLDSTLVLLAASLTFDELGWDRKGIKTFSLPGFGTSNKTRRNARKLGELFGTTFREVSIVENVKAELRDHGHEPCGVCLLCENTQARYRTEFLMNEGFVLGTGDLSELALGWCTYNGDQMSMYNVNQGVPKTLVKYIVAWAAEKQLFGAPISKTLISIVKTEISPELIKQKRGAKVMAQKTEDLIGPYPLNDFYLYHMVRFGFSPTKIAFLCITAFDGVFDRAVIRKWLPRFYKRFFGNEFKRHPSPDGVKIGAVSLNPRGDWRMPSDVQGDLWINEAESISE